MQKPTKSNKTYTLGQLEKSKLVRANGEPASITTIRRRLFILGIEAKGRSKFGTCYAITPGQIKKLNSLDT
jgi:hypothetical protein